MKMIDDQRPSTSKVNKKYLKDSRLLKELLTNYIYIENGIKEEQIKPTIVQVYVNDQHHLNAYNKIRKGTLNDSNAGRPSTNRSRSRSRPYEGSEFGVVKPASKPRKQAEDHVNKAGPSKVGSKRIEISNTESDEMLDVDWMDKVFGTRKKKISRPKVDDSKQSSYIKKKQGFSTSLLRMRSKQQQNIRKTSRAWTEDSREQFLHSLTKDDSEQRKKDYLAKNAGKHDTEVLGLDVPFVDSRTLSNQIRIETRKKKTVVYTTPSPHKPGAYVGKSPQISRLNFK